jgi:guanylate kinase
MNDHKLGLVYVLSAPSGAGKTSLVTALLAQPQNVDVCVSHTTRKPREGELNGKEYFFVSRESFHQTYLKGGFVESAEVFGNQYGTSVAEIERITNIGHDVILEIDWQGARQVKALYPERTVSIFVLPPSIEVLESRLKDRGKDCDETIAARMQKAKNEISHCHEYKYMIVNDDFDEALSDLASIFRIEHLRHHQLSKVNALVANLLG